MGDPTGVGGPALRAVRVGTGHRPVRWPRLRARDRWARLRHLRPRRLRPARHRHGIDPRSRRRIGPVGPPGNRHRPRPDPGLGRSALPAHPGDCRLGPETARPLRRRVWLHLAAPARLRGGALAGVRLRTAAARRHPDARGLATSNHRRGRGRGPVRPRGGQPGGPHGADSPGSPRRTVPGRSGIRSRALGRRRRRDHSACRSVTATAP